MAKDNKKLFSLYEIVFGKDAKYVYEDNKKKRKRIKIKWKKK